MRRFVLSMAVGAALALVAAVPAGAQYEPPPTTSTTTSTTTTTTSTTLPAGPPLTPRVEATVSDTTPQPGDVITVAAPPAFAPGTPVVVNLARAQRGAAAAQIGGGDADANGSVSESATIPAVEPGVYWLYVTGVDTDGNPVVAILPIVMTISATEAAAVEGDTFEASAAGAPVVAATAPVPAAVAELQSVEPDVEAAVADAVADGADVLLSPQGALQVRTAAGVLQDADSLPRTGANDISQQVTIGAALLLAGTGMVLLRRRRGGFTK